MKWYRVKAAVRRFFIPAEDMNGVRIQFADEVDSTQGRATVFENHEDYCGQILLYIHELQKECYVKPDHCRVLLEHRPLNKAVSRVKVAMMRRHGKPKPWRCQTCNYLNVLTNNSCLRCGDFKREYQRGED